MKDLTNRSTRRRTCDHDQKIEALRDELRKLKAEQERKLAELRSLFIERAHAIYPIVIGTEVEYEPGKFGRVDQEPRVVVFGKVALRYVTNCTQ